MRDGCRSTLTVRVDVDSVPEPAADRAIDALWTDPGAYRIVLTTGRFVSADGFQIRGRPAGGDT